MISHASQLARGPVIVSEVQRAGELAAELLGVRASRVAPIRHGNWSRAYLVVGNRVPYVLRLSKTGRNFQKDQWIARIALGSRVRVPQILRVGQCGGLYYSLAEWLPGRSLDSFGSLGLRLVVPRLLRVLDSLRDIVIEGTSGYGDWGAFGVAPHGSWQEYLVSAGRDEWDDAVQGWHEELAKFREALSRYEAAYRVMCNLSRFCPEVRHLIHGDLLNHNLVVTADFDIGLLDWGWSKFGDPLYDIARLCFWQYRFPRWRRVDIQSASQLHMLEKHVDISNFRERLACYQIHAGLLSQQHLARRGRWRVLYEVGERTLAVADAYDV
jgi:aminoglycoside phosphotransferase (APT) family kinase protein